MNITRPELLNQLSQTVTRRRRDGPVLVAIDGRSAAGKTTLADELAVHLREQGLPVLRSSIDDFHPPGHKYRSRERRYTARTYYDEGFDYATFRRLMLEPLRSGGNRRCCPVYWDSYNDVAFPKQWVATPDNVVAIVDGVFLLRPELQRFWDHIIWLHINWETMIERAARRDVAWTGSVERVIEKYRTVTQPMHELYESEIDPARLAHTIVDNEVPERPRLLRKPCIE